MIGIIKYVLLVVASLDHMISNTHVIGSKPSSYEEHILNLPPYYYQFP